MQNAIIIPGLGDHAGITAWTTKRWLSHGLNPIIYPMSWNDGEEFKPKLEGLLEKIDEYASTGEKLSLIGCSAGASAALNAFCERKDRINKVISICGRLRTGSQTGFRSLKSRARSSPAFKQSVELFESRQPLLSAQDKKKIITVSAKFGDELVPANTSAIEGCCNIDIPIMEHTIAIYTALTVFYGRLISFV